MCTIKLFLFICFIYSSVTLPDNLMSEMSGLSELPLEKLLQVKTSLENQNESPETEDVHEVLESQEIVARIGSSQAQSLTNAKFKKPLKRGSHEMWEKKGSSKSKLSSIFQIAVTALAFLAFKGYLLCLLVQAIKAKQNLSTATANGAALVFATPVKRVRPIIIRQRRDVWLDADPDDMYYALRTFSEGFTAYHTVDFNHYNYTVDSFGKGKKRSVIKKPLIAGQYEIRSFICDGTFGKVMLAVNINSKLTVAAKLEPMDSRFPQLPTEFKIYEILGCETPGFIKVFHYGPCDRMYNALIMELLGPDLDDLFEMCNFNFSYKTVLYITMQTLQLIQYIHKKGIIYRDIKPENFCIGQKLHDTEKVIHIIDFGLSKILDANIITSETPQVDLDYLVGTARYMSVNAHNGVQQSKRDDLESLGYMYMYFLNGRLPWMGLSRGKDLKNHYRAIAERKETICLEKELKKYPEFLEYMIYVKKLDFHTEPDYDYLINLVRNKFQEMNYNEDGEYDWTAGMNVRYLETVLSLDPDD